MRHFLRLMYSTISALLIVVFSSSGIFAQTNVKGTVTNESNQPLTGATVAVKGTTRATSSDNNGHFTIAAPSNAVLVFSRVDYATKEVPVNNQANLNVQMQLG